jgi:hypothetical protein
MAVLKQISPTRVPVAPNDFPSKYLPSSRARRARIQFKNVQRSTLNAQRSTKIHSELKHWALDVQRSPRRSPAKAEADWAFSVAKKEKGLDRQSTQAFAEFLPRRCRLGESPVPFR